ncbi:MAG: hypothetical protein AAFW01_06390, partial [Pseudomonadota bacterium]
VAAAAALNSGGVAAATAADAATSAANAARCARASRVFVAAHEAAAAVYNAIDNAYDASARDADAAAIREGYGAASLARRPLWVEGRAARFFAEGWDALKTRLLAREGEHWEVWTEWYEARLRGDPGNPALEYDRVTSPEIDWKAGPATVNAKIKEIIERHTVGSRPPPSDAKSADGSPPRVPEPPLAPLEFSVEGDILVLSDAELLPSPSASVEAVWTVLLETLTRLQDSGLGNAPGILDLIKRLAAALGESSSEVDVIRSGMAGLELQALVKGRLDVVTDETRSALNAAAAQHALLMAQFEDWMELRAKLASLAQPELDRKVGHASTAVVEVIVQTKVASPLAERALLEAQEAGSPLSVDGETVEPDPVAVVGFGNSVRAGITAFANKVVEEYGKKAAGAVADSAITGTKVAFFFVAAGSLTYLAQIAPAAWGWVVPFLSWLRLVAGV